MTVRTRIAPSPTGAPHVGTAYMALFNLAFARKHQGQMILRIEDTDQSRSTKESEDAILSSLKWLGLDWDEGPDCGGEFGPYRQSERLEIYREHAKILLEKDRAYYCFCTADRLAEMRAMQEKNKTTQGYDGHCRNLSPIQIKQNIEEGLNHVIRLKMPKSGTCKIEDKLRGDVELDFSQSDDQVLLKSDGFPTYHLAVVVDDFSMKISHVIRGEEWITSTPKHLVLYDAFGWKPPEYIHLPLLLNPDGTKMSKRRNPTSIEYYRRAGYSADALLNYLSLMAYPAINEEEKFFLARMLFPHVSAVDYVDLVTTKKGENEQALNDCNESLKIDPNYSKAVHRRGKARFEMGQYELALEDFRDKPTALTVGQQEASSILWTSADGHCKIGIWECQPGHFTADRSAAGEYCHIIKGKATVTKVDGDNPREIEAGDLLVLPQGWKGEWIIHEHMRKLFVIDASPNL